MCQAMGRALGYGEMYDTAKWTGLVSERGLLLARVLGLNSICRDVMHSNNNVVKYDIQLMPCHQQISGARHIIFFIEV